MLPLVYHQECFILLLIKVFNSSSFIYLILFLQIHIVNDKMLEE